MERDALLERFVESELSQREFCEAVGLSRRTLQTWLRNVRASEDDPDTGDPEPGLTLLEVKLEDQPRTASAQTRSARTKAEAKMIWPDAAWDPKHAGPKYEVVLGDGKRLQISSGFNPAEVAMLVGILEGR